MKRRDRIMGRARWGALVALLGTLSGGCGLFDPASPELPTALSGAGHVTLDYSSTTAALATIAKAIAAKGQGNAQDAYLGAFARLEADGVGCVVTFDREVLTRYYGGIQPTWTYDQERNFYGRFREIRPRDAYVMRWAPYLPAGSDLIDADEQTLHRHYEVFAVDADDIAIGTVAIGWADLTFRRIAQRWAMVRWEDHVDPAVGVDPAEPDRLSFSKRRLDTQ